MMVMTRNNENDNAQNFMIPPNVLLCRAGHGNDRKHGALSPASARAAC
jgi:hypothetical protein